MQGRNGVRDLKEILVITKGSDNEGLSQGSGHGGLWDTRVGSEAGSGQGKL